MKAALSKKSKTLLRTLGLVRRAMLQDAGTRDDLTAFVGSEELAKGSGGHSRILSREIDALARARYLTQPDHHGERTINRAGWNAAQDLDGIDPWPVTGLDLPDPYALGTEPDQADDKRGSVP